MIDEFRSGRYAFFARLDDLARRVSVTMSPLASAIVAHVAGTGGVITQEEAVRIASFWDVPPDSGAVHTRRPLIVLDALDELPTASGLEHARRAARALDSNGHPVVVTSRVAGYTQPWREVSTHYAMAPLSSDAQDSFTRNWFEAFEPQAKGRLATALQEIPDDILESPLTLGFVCVIAQAERVPIHRAGIFDRFATPLHWT